MAVYGYSRVSTSRQAEEGDSLEAQERAITGHAMIHGLLVSESFVERGISGSMPLRDRPRGRELLAKVQPGDILISAKLDRMFRSALDALEVLKVLKERNVSLHLIDLGGDVIGNAVSKLIFTILSAVAEAERDRIRERVSTVKAHQKLLGRYLGGKIPYGFKLVEEGGESKLAADPAQQTVIVTIDRLRREGKSLRKIQQAIKEQDTHLSVDAIARICRDTTVVTQT